MGGTSIGATIAGLFAMNESFEDIFEKVRHYLDFKILETFASGPIVINRRVDRFALKQPLTVEVVGVFFVKDGKIKEWSDYTIRLQRG